MTPTTDITFNPDGSVKTFASDARAKPATGLHLLTPDDPRWALLFMPTTEVTDIAEQVLPFTADLAKLMKFHNGISIAAPQVGLPLRFFVTDFPHDTNLAVVINPKILRCCAAGTKADEGCLSFPGETQFVWRPAWIDCEWTNQNGEQVRDVHLYGYQARVFQHEYDHLFGTTVFDRVSNAKLPVVR